jgi:hypothetical protein
VNPHHIAVYNHSTLVNDDEIAWWVLAVDKQLREHCAPLWDGAPCGVAFYGNAHRLPADKTALLGIVDDDGNAESAGYHSQIGDRIFGLVDMSQAKNPSVVLSHEVLEMYANAHLTRKVSGPKGREYYIEICDPTQRDDYQIEAELFGKTRHIAVSDFVLPEWYGLPNVDKHDGRTTYLDRHELEQFEVAPGGYQIAEESDGEIVFLAKAEARMSRSSFSRTDRIRRRKFVKNASES